MVKYEGLNDKVREYASAFISENEYGNTINIEQHAKDSRLTEASNGKIYDYRRMLGDVKQLGRPLIEEEAEKYRIK